MVSPDSLLNKVKSVWVVVVEWLGLLSGVAFSSRVAVVDDELLPTTGGTAASGVVSSGAGTVAVVSLLSLLLLALGTTRRGGARPAAPPRYHPCVLPLLQELALTKRQLAIMVQAARVHLISSCSLDVCGVFCRASFLFVCLFGGLKTWIWKCATTTNRERSNQRTSTRMPNAADAVVDEDGKHGWRLFR